jgi:hypothetical protein
MTSDSHITSLFHICAYSYLQFIVEKLWCRPENRDPDGPSISERKCTQSRHNKTGRDASAASEEAEREKKIAHSSSS